MRHRITQRAEADLKDIYRYTAHAFGQRQAEKYLRELNAAFEMIGDHPEIGRLYESSTRHFIHGKHIILYRALRDEVVIGRIFHGARALPTADR
jgi:toxin ParE1/3/4